MSKEYILRNKDSIMIAKLPPHLATHIMAEFDGELTNIKYKNKRKAKKFTFTCESVTITLDSWGGEKVKLFCWEGDKIIIEG